MRSTTTSETFLEFDETFSCRYHGCSGSNTHKLQGAFAELPYIRLISEQCC